MITELISFITKLKRPEIIEDRNSGESYLYNDGRNAYERIKKNRSFCRRVCNVDSFAKAVIEQVRRDGEDQDASGMTVVFDELGGTFYTDDTLKDEQDHWLFKREHTLLWNTVCGLINSEQMPHKELLRTLESVKIFIPNFEILYNSILKLRASKKIQFVSNPIFENGEQSGSYQWEQKVNDMTQTVACPSEIEFKGKIVRGSEIEYQFSLPLTPILDDETGKILFSVSMPGFDMVLDQVREDEYQAFCKQVKDMKNLLILRNY